VLEGEFSSDDEGDFRD